MTSCYKNHSGATRVQQEKGDYGISKIHYSPDVIFKLAQSESKCRILVKQLVIFQLALVHKI